MAETLPEANPEAENRALYEDQLRLWRTNCYVGWSGTTLLTGAGLEAWAVHGTVGRIATGLATLALASYGPSSFRAIRRELQAEYDQPPTEPKEMNIANWHS